MRPGRVAGVERRIRTPVEQLRAASTGALPTKVTGYRILYVLFDISTSLDLGRGDQMLLPWAVLENIGQLASTVKRLCGESCSMLGSPHVSASETPVVDVTVGRSVGTGWAGAGNREPSRQERRSSRLKCRPGFSLEPDLADGWSRPIPI